MITPERPLREAARVRALHKRFLLDTPQEKRYDRITDKLARMLGVSMAYLALIDADRQWLKSVVGPLACEIERDVAFCSHTILQSEPLVVSDTHKDPRFVHNPLVTGQPHIRFYAGIPLRSTNGHNIGTLCVADSKPRTLSFDDLETLKAFATLVEQKINERRKIIISYSYLDKPWKDRLVGHLKALEERNLLDFWDDRRIGVGGAWRNQIQEAVESASTVILLISANYLTSRFVLMDDFTHLLLQRHTEGLTLLPVLVQPCRWNTVEGFDSVEVYPKTDHALAEGSAQQIDQHLTDLAATVVDTNPHLRHLLCNAPNPFLNHAERLATVLHHISRQYDEEGSTYRDVVLQEALRQTMNGAASHPASTLIARTIARKVA